MRFIIHLECGECQRLLRVLLAYHKALLAHSQEEGQEIRDDGNFAEPALGLRCSNEGFTAISASSVSLDAQICLIMGEPLSL